jgi:uncharacterized protein YerC
MSQVSTHFMSPKISSKVYEVFIDSIKNSRSKSEVISFLDDLLSPTEKTMLAKRVAIAYLLLEDKYTYREISKILKISLGTIAKVHATFALKGEGYRKIVGNLVTNKTIKNLISEFLDLITPTKHTLSGERYLKPKIDSRNMRKEPL